MRHFSTKTLKTLPSIKSLTYSIQSKDFQIKEHPSIDQLVHPSKKYYLIRDYPSQTDSSSTLTPYFVQEQVYGNQFYNILSGVK